MYVTIGELVNELCKYSNSVETRIVKQTPVLKARLTSKSNLVKVFLYVAQVGIHKYTAIADLYNNSGSKFIPTGNTSDPFIREMDKIRIMHGGSGIVDESKTSKINNTTYEGIIDFILSLLINNELISISRQQLHGRLTSMNLNTKTSRIINRTFACTPYRSGSILDLHSIVIRDRTPFSLDGLNVNDMKNLIDKLNNAGIIITIDKKSIIDFTFKRK